MTDRELVAQYIPMMKFIAEICGPRCEVAIHCLDDFDHSIVAIENGHVSGRKVGDGLLNYNLDTLFDERYTKRDFLTNYYGHRLKEGQILRFSNFYIKDETGRLVGFLSVNMDISQLESIRSFIDSELNFFKSNHDAIDLLVSHEEPFEISATDMVRSTCREALNKLAISDVKHLTKAERMKIIRILNERNLFSLKGAVQITARELQISEPSVYRYLNDIRNSASQTENEKMTS